MHTPTTAELLQAWERAGDAPVAWRCLWLLGSGCEEHTIESLARLPLGRRDALLLELRARLFGDRWCGVARCPECDTAVEAVFDGDALLAAQLAASAEPTALEHVCDADGMRVRFRLPDSNDLLALQACRDLPAARQRLLDRCVLDVQGGQGARPPHALPKDVQDRIAQAMASTDPQADLQLALTCPECAHHWQPAFDVARFLWQELHAWALRMLREVDMLARVYHWSEADILALSPRRRQAYLEQCLP